MKKKLARFTPIFVFILLVGMLLYDIVITSSEISRNSAVIENIENNLNKIETNIAKTRLKIEKFRKDPKAAEALLRKKFEMLRKDQYYIND